MNLCFRCCCPYALCWPTPTLMTHLSPKLRTCTRRTGQSMKPLLAVGRRSTRWGKKDVSGICEKACKCMKSISVQVNVRNIKNLSILCDLKLIEETSLSFCEYSFEGIGDGRKNNCNVSFLRYLVNAWFVEEIMLVKSTSAWIAWLNISNYILCFIWRFQIDFLYSDWWTRRESNYWKAKITSRRNASGKHLLKGHHFWGESTRDLHFSKVYGKVSHELFSPEVIIWFGHPIITPK